MTSSPYPLETSGGKALALALSKRVLLVSLVWCIEALYVPTSWRMAGGIEPKLSIDIFPIWSIWVVPYVLCYIFWLAGFVWITFKMEDRLFQAFIVACTLTFSIAVATYIFFPTYVRAAPLEGRDIFTVMLRFFHVDQGRYDAFPSGHIFITTLLALFLSRWYPRSKPIWIVTVIIIALSTLFTGQHYILDIIGGLVAALAGYHLGLWWAGFYSAPETIDDRSKRRVSSSSSD